MSLKAHAAKLFAARIHRKNQKWIANPIQAQEKVFKSLIKKAVNTQFGKDHNFNTKWSKADFAANVPIRDYEGLRVYIEQVVAGKKNVIWPVQPKYWAKTSGTTSGVKFIPITNESIKEQVRASRDAMLNYIYETGNANFVDGKMIFLQGSPELKKLNGIKIGRLSGISAHYVPKYLQKNRLPSLKTNCIEDWETKVNAIVAETKDQDMTVIAGIPSWVQMYFERLIQVTGKKVGNLFKNLQLFIYGGVNYEPYRKKMEELIGRKIDSIELFPASEGFFAYQNVQKDNSLLLLVDAGIYYEFVPADAFFEEDPPRLTLQDVELGINYVMVISTNAGLWAYNLGDTIQFVSLKPYKIVVSGRIKHFISAFGEHVIAKEVEQAMQEAIAGTDAIVNEFTVAPQITPDSGELPYHEWLVEFEREPTDSKRFAQILDQSLQDQNTYYFDLIEGSVLQPLVVVKIEPNGFKKYMRSIGRLGGQNKVQRLANDRKVADGLYAFRLPQA